MLTKPHSNGAANANGTNGTTKTINGTNGTHTVNGVHSVLAGVRSVISAPDVGWTFLSNHTHVLLCLAHDPSARVRDVADAVGITERAVQRILSDLEEGGIIERSRDGRRNRYTIHTDRSLRHPIESHRTIGDLLNMAPSVDPTALATSEEEQ